MTSLAPSMPRTPRATSAGPNVPALLDELELTLIGLLKEQQRLLVCIRSQREAIRTGKLREVPMIAAEEQSIIRRVRDLEARRQQAALLLRDVLVPPPPRAVGTPPSMPTISEIIERVEEPMRSRLSEIAGKLKALATEVRRESSIVRQAADALGKHLGGIVMTVNSALSRAGVYGRQGRVLVGEAIESAVDLRS